MVRSESLYTPSCSFALRCPDALAALYMHPNSGLVGIGPESSTDEIEFGCSVHCEHHNIMLDSASTVMYIECMGAIKSPTCLKGHPWDSKRPDGANRCSICMREYQRIYREKTKHTQSKGVR